MENNMKIATISSTESPCTSFRNADLQYPVTKFSINSEVFKEYRNRKLKIKKKSGS